MDNNKAQETEIANIQIVDSQTMEYLSQIDEEINKRIKAGIK